MEYNKQFFEKVFSAKRMERYYRIHSENIEMAITHYECNLLLSESFYITLSTFEVALRNAFHRELMVMSGREDWYNLFLNDPKYKNLHPYIINAKNQIYRRGENITPSKIVSELTFGFWTTLVNAEYEQLLWKSLRKAFPNIPKTERKRKIISSAINRFRKLRNRVFHNESICWNINFIENIHKELLTVLEWINVDLISWTIKLDCFNKTCNDIKTKLGWD